MLILLIVVLVLLFGGGGGYYYGRGAGWGGPRILNSAQRMERMIADLLDLTRTRLGGAIPLKRGRLDLQRLCDEVLLEVR